MYFQKINIYVSINKSTIKIKCSFCDNEYERYNSWYKAKLKSKPNKKWYCSGECQSKDKFNKIDVNCKNCNKSFLKLPNEIKKSPNHFCSKSCSATYNNKNKTHGTRRSKLEKWLEEQLTILYPKLEIHYNRKDAINSELDIYIPSLKLAVELNGIFHYEPIYGKDKLKQIANNDNRKFQACLENNIELCIIDSSKLSYFKPANAKKYLDIILKVLNKKMVRVGFEPTV